MNPFRRPAAHYGRTPEPETPYQRATQVWDDRIGSARVQARNWRLAALMAIGLSAGLTAGLVVHTARGSVTPWVVQVDAHGEPQVVAPAEAAFDPSDAQIAWHLGRFIEQVRSLPADPVVVRNNWLRAYDYTTDQGAAALSDHARASDPFAQIGRSQVGVEISSIIRASPSSFRIAWTERRFIDGRLAATERWTAIVTVVVRPPRTADGLRKNPLGVLVHAFNWSKEAS